VTGYSVDSFEQLVEDLTGCAIGSTFNLFRDEVPGLDVKGGAARRRENLLRYLKARSKAEIIAVGEAAGYRGMRFSGIAFTSERTLASWGGPYAPSSIRLGGWTEQSATIVHRVLGELGAEERVLLWNTVPTHPHPLGKPLKNRKPRKAEIEAGASYGRRLIDIVQPRIVVAIGRVAESSLDKSSPYGVHYARHPANGGAAKFRDDMRRLLGLDG
jgi:hypothetical protein